jgi:1-hydroxycarotenoid 3,4-desaturase
MHRLARALEAIATARGARFSYGAHVEEIEVANGAVRAVRLQGGDRIAADRIVFNGDPRALASGAMGQGFASVAPRTLKDERSLSAEVWAFSAKPDGPDLAHHNVFFRDDPEPEFAALRRGELVPDPTLYICAQDRGGREQPPAMERFEIIANAPPLKPQALQQEDFSPCQTRVFRTLDKFGLTFTPEPGPEALTTPRMFDRLFPASLGSIYGQSPHGMLAAFRRPVARTPIKGLYLAGGGAHPGAGVPMATLSARHAAEAILSDRISISPSRRTGTHGGMSTESAIAAPAQSASSRS